MNKFYLAALLSLACLSNARAAESVSDAVSTLNAAVYLCYLPEVSRHSVLPKDPDAPSGQEWRTDCESARTVGFAVDNEQPKGANAVARLSQALDRAKDMKPEFVDRYAVYTVDIGAERVVLRFVKAGDRWLITHGGVRE